MTEMPHLIGGALCLDFVNTVDPRHASGRREYLDSYPALVAWGSHAGVIDAEQGDRLRETAAVQPAEAGRVLSRAIGLREALYPLISQAGSRRRPARDDLGVLQAEVTGALAHFGVAWSPEGFGWEWDQASPGLDRVLWPVAWSAAELLAQGPLERIGSAPVRTPAAGCSSTSARTPAAAGATCACAATGPRPAATTSARWRRRTGLGAGRPRRCDG